MRALTAFLLMLSSAGVAHAETKLAVLPLAAKRVDKGTVEILDDLLVNEVDRLRTYKVISAQDINAVLGLDKMKEALGCSDVSCAAEIGGALGVEFLLTGSVSKLGQQVIVSLTLLDTKKSEVKSRSQSKAQNNEEEYAYAIQVAVARLMKLPEPQRTTGGSGSSNEALRVEQERAAGQFRTKMFDAAPPPAPMAPSVAAVGGDYGATGSSKLIISSQEDSWSYDVKVYSPVDGNSYSCPNQVTYGVACSLEGVPAGPAVVEVGAPANERFDITVRPGITTYDIDRQGPALLIAGAAVAGPGLLLLLIGASIDNDISEYDGTERMGVGKLLLTIFGGTLAGTGAIIAIVGAAVQNQHHLWDQTGGYYGQATSPGWRLSSIDVAPTDGGAMAVAGFTF